MVGFGCGCQRDFRPTSAWTGCCRFQGRQPIIFESEITGFVGNGGKAALRLGGEYDVY